MITKKQVQHIAKLARISLNKKEIEKFQKELSLILDYIEKLKEVDISKIEATFHLVPELRFEKGMREDEPKKEEIERIKKLIKSFPERKNSYLKTKPIL